ncbi:MAG: tryptophan--tRNA ligase [Acidobacteria bacterium]|nr:MAG: tryptophan--tRNA ligase [Acidobacteriota bacterium]
MRPTGRLHIGHYFGALCNWIRMQEEYDCFFFVADWHALTTHYAEDTRLVPQNTLEIATDWLAAGLDPEKCIMFVQSRVLEHAELHLLLSMVTPLSWLERVPTYKEQIEQLKDKDLSTYGFLGYPLLQAADIVIYEADLVPVGEDQVPHVELTREIVRRFNFYYGFRIREELLAPENRKVLEGILQPYGESRLLPESAASLNPDQESKILGVLMGDAKDGGVENFLEKFREYRKFFDNRKVLREPGVMLTETPRFPGTDGRRMAKSYDNAIWLSESDESIRAKTKVMMTDPARKRRQDPGNPDVCPVFSWHKLFSPPETIAWSDQGCRTAAIGCIECKAAMADNLIRWIEPIRARRREYEADPERVREILHEGSNKARKVATRTMRRVREAVFGNARRAKGEDEADAKAQAAMGS